MKNILSSKNIRLVILILIVASIALLSFYSYNEYAYQKITTCIAEGNYSLAENYIDSVSPNYRDLRKIKNLLSTISTLESNDNSDFERILSRMESYKGFEDEKVNQVYNTLLFSLYKDSLSTNTDNSEITTAYNSSAAATSEAETTSHQNEVKTTTAIYTTTYSTSEITTEITTQQYIPTTTEIITTTPASTTQADTTSYYSTETVYYVESGEVYHIDSNCRTLARSTNIFSGPIPEGRRACKVCSQ